MPSDLTGPRPGDDRLTGWIVRRRAAFFLLAVSFLLVAFNGQWRIGRDSAGYRAIARNRAAGGRYTIRPDPPATNPPSAARPPTPPSVQRYFHRYESKQESLYPGLPYILAALDRLFGPADPLRPTLALTLMSAMAAATLLVVYRLMRLAAAPWLAIAVTSGLAINHIFLEYANELMSDVPFLLGLCTALYGYELLRRAPTFRRALLALGRLLPGLLLAAACRPTVWVFVAAWGTACVWGLFFPGYGVGLPLLGARRDESDPNARGASPAGASSHPPAGASPHPPAGVIEFTNLAGRPKPSRLPYAVSLGLLAALGLAFVAFGSATSSAHLRERLADLPTLAQDAWRHNLPHMLEQDFCEAFYGVQLLQGVIPLPGTREAEAVRPSAAAASHGRVTPPQAKAGLSSLYSLLAIFAGVWLARRNVLWGLLVLFTVGTTVVLGPNSRYYLMILPLLLAGWGHFCWHVARRPIFRRGHWREIALIFGLGLVVVPNVVMSLNVIREQRGLDKHLTHHPFLDVYRDGKWAAAWPVAKMIHDHTRPDQRIIAPESTVLTYLSNRQVYGMAPLTPGTAIRQGTPSLIDAGDFDFALFPPSDGKAEESEADSVSATHWSLFDDKDKMTAAVIDRGILIPEEEVAHTPAGDPKDSASEAYRLSAFRVRDPWQPRHPHHHHHHKPTPATTATQ